MSTAIKVMRQIQVGIESTPGMAVDAVERMIVQGKYEWEQATWDPVDVDSGVFARVPTSPVITRNASRVEMSAPIDFTQILLPLLTGMEGGVTPTGAMADKTWAFLPDTAAPPSLDTATVEYAEASPDDVSELEFYYGFTDQMKFTLTSEGIGEMMWSMWGRATQQGTLTAALGVPALIRPANLLWRVDVDDTWAGLGTTNIPAQVYGAEWSYNNNTRPGYYLDGRTALDFTQPEYGRPAGEIFLDVVHDPDSASFVEDEETNKAALTQRFIQLQVTGPSLGGSAYSITLNMACYHAEDSMQTRGEDRDGNPSVRMHFLSAYDATSTNHVGVTVVNAETSFG